MTEFLKEVKEWSPVAGVVLAALLGHLTLKLDKKLSDFREELRKEFVSREIFDQHKRDEDSKMDMIIGLIQKLGGGGKTFVWSPPSPKATRGETGGG